jgi:hypothetical protein
MTKHKKYISTSWWYNNRVISKHTLLTPLLTHFGKLIAFSFSFD